MDDDQFRMMEHEALMQQGAREKVDAAELALHLETYLDGFVRCWRLGVPIWMAMAMCRMYPGEGPTWPPPAVRMTELGKACASLGVWVVERLAPGGWRRRPKWLDAEARS